MTNLLKIRDDDYEQFIEYKVMFYENEQAFKTMEEVEQRTATAVELLTGITAHCSRDRDAIDAQRMVALQVGPRFSLKL